MDLKRGIDKAVETIVSELSKQAVAVDDSSDKKSNKWLLFLQK